MDVFKAGLAINGLEVFEGGGHVAGVPQRDGVDYETEGVEPVFLAFSIGLAELAAVAVEHVPGQGVACLTTVELDQDASSVGLVVEVCEQEDGLGDPARSRRRPDLSRWDARRPGGPGAARKLAQIRLGGTRRRGRRSSQWAVMSSVLMRWRATWSNGP